MPKCDFARVTGAESAENSGFRAYSDYSLLPTESDLSRAIKVSFKKI